MLSKEKLLEWLDVEDDLSTGHAPVLKADRWAFKHTKKMITEGKFDIEIPADRLQLAYDRAPVEGSLGVVWHDAAKEAYQDGILTALEILNIKVKGLNG